MLAKQDPHAQRASEEGNDQQRNEEGGEHSGISILADLAQLQLNARPLR